MSQPRLVVLLIAAHELARHWDIPDLLAEQIVRGVLQGHECFVRGRGPDGILRDISNEIGSTLLSHVSLSAGFSEVEIDWNGLLLHGRKLVPPEWEYFVSAAEARETLTRDAAITELLESGARPPRTVSWPAFCDAVRDRADGWISKRDGKHKLGFGNRQIRRVVTNWTKQHGRHGKPR
jgi:hypothetical protein